MNPQFDIRVTKHPQRSQSSEDPQTLAKVRILTRTKSGLRFAIVSESAATRFFKQLHILKEIEIGDKTFDDLVYVLGDEPALKDLVAESGAFRRFCEWVATHKYKISFSRSKIKFQARVTNEEVPKLLLEAQTYIRDALTELELSLTFHQSPKYLAIDNWDSLYIFYLGAILVLNLFIMFSTSSVPGDDFRAEFQIWAVGSSLVATVVTAFLWTLIRGRHSYAHKQLGWLALISFSTSWLMFAHVYGHLNRTLNQSEGVRVGTTTSRSTASLRLPR